MTKSIIYLTIVVGFLLLIPLLAMNFTDEVLWDLPDFVVAGTLFFVTGFVYIFATRKNKNIAYRSVVGIVLIAALMFIWVILAVDIF